MLRIGVGAFLGAGVGTFLTAGWLIGGLLFGYSPNLSTVALTMVGLVGGSALAGAGVAYWRAKRVPTMLPHHRAQHQRLREMVQQIRANLNQMTGLRSTYPELDEVLKKDAELRHRASRLHAQIMRQAQRELSWVDHLTTAWEVWREGGLSGVSRTEWAWRAYRAKMERELNALGRRVERNRDPHLEATLTNAYRQKARELASFRNLERTLQTLENESTVIVTSVESLLVETIRLSSAPPSTTPQLDTLLSPLREQISAFEQAIDELYRIPSETDPDEVRIGQQPHGSP